MTSRYAETTEVSTDRSLAEIRKTLLRYGATSFMFGEDAGHMFIAFVAEARQVRIAAPLPGPNDREFTVTPTGKQRAPAAAAAAYETAVRRVYRVIAAVVKMNLEAVASGVLTFEAAFLAHVVLPSGQTVGESVADAVSEAYRTRQVRPLLPSGQP